MSDAKRPSTQVPTAPEGTPGIARRGLLFVLSSPSGAGKTTLARNILAADPNIAMSVSVTTRKSRPGEVDGKDYFFISDAEFARRRDAGELLEWAAVFDHFYGTPKAPVDAALAAGRDVLFDIDWQGAQQLNEQMPHDLVRIFILPPDGKTLERRLTPRAQDPPDVVARRMQKAAGEISHWPEYDYVIVNRDVNESHELLLAILTAERLKRRRQTGLTSFVRSILDSL
ncbi:MAG TPA: guanylate kinase [Hyphomicrobiaceae bacterium]|nr:guanylate kinase [Hyphomicrobiaceae bacterium]